MSKIIGIDLGTTNSCVSIMEGSQPKVLEVDETPTQLDNSSKNKIVFKNLFFIF